MRSLLFLTWCYEFPFFAAASEAASAALAVLLASFYQCVHLSCSAADAAARSCHGNTADWSPVRVKDGRSSRQHSLGRGGCPWHSEGARRLPSTQSDKQTDRQTGGVLRRQSRPRLRSVRPTARRRGCCTTQQPPGRARAPSCRALTRGLGARRLPGRPATARRRTTQWRNCCTRIQASGVAASRRNGDLDVKDKRLGVGLSNHL